MPKLEKAIEGSFVTWCGSRGLACVKMIGFANNGFPDRTIFLPMGRTAYIEFKAIGGRLSPRQELWIGCLRKLGHHVLVTDDLTEAKEFIEGLL
jgi:hypothetical protein